MLLLSSSAYAQSGDATQNPSPSARRVALVIGNGAYETVPLKNPVNDASDMAQVLRTLGFDVIHRENVNLVDMKRAIRAFGEQIRKSGVALFYYAGHGIQVNGRNYLVPTGATIEREEEVEYETVDVGFVLAQMEDSESQTKVVILDACRNNPFARRFRSVTRGLASITAPSGTLIAYATAPGSVAADGRERNGVYTQELLTNIQAPGLGAEDVFKRVRIAVRERTRGQQTPWESSSLVGNFYFTNVPGTKIETGSGRRTVPPEPGTQPVVLFEEHFSDNRHGWAVQSRNEVSLAVQDGSYLFQHKINENSWFSTKRIALTDADDFTIECTAAKVDGPDIYGYGLVWGAHDNKNRYYFTITGNGQFAVSKRQDGKLVRLIPWSYPNSINKFNARNKLAILKEGDRLRFFINDIYVGGAQYEPQFGNRVGFIVFDRQTIAFDDFMVTVKRK